MPGVRYNKQHHLFPEAVTWLLKLNCYVMASTSRATPHSHSSFIAPTSNSLLLRPFLSINVFVFQGNVLVCDGFKRV